MKLQFFGFSSLNSFFPSHVKTFLLDGVTVSEDHIVSTLHDGRNQRSISKALQLGPNPFAGLSTVSTGPTVWKGFVSFSTPFACSTRPFFETDRTRRPSFLPSLQLHLSSTNADSQFGIRAARIPGLNYPTHTFSTPLFPSPPLFASAVLSLAGVVAKETNRSFLKDSQISMSISNKRSVYIYEISMDSDPEGYQLSQLKKAGGSR